MNCAAGFPLKTGQSCAKCGSGPSGPCWEHYKQVEAALLALANAADDVGVRFFDTDTMEPEVQAMQKATLAARALLK